MVDEFVRSARETSHFRVAQDLNGASRGSDDVNGDGLSDVVWRDTSSGATALWLMNPSGLNQEATFPGGAGLAWIIQGVGDVNGDWLADLIWRDTENGATAVWIMNTAGLREGDTFPGGAALSWAIQGVGDVKRQWDRGFNLARYE